MATNGIGSPPLEGCCFFRVEVLPFARELRPAGRLPLGLVEAPFRLREVVDARVAMMFRVGESTS